MAVIDLNADVGERGAESLADDLAILDAVTSANVACGFHAGDTETMRAICAAAVARDVRIGAHVGYDDRPNFGRVDRDVAPDRLRAETTHQLDALAAAAAAAGGRVSYVKPHGALYSRAAADPPTATAIVEAAAAFDPGLAILGPPGSRLLEAAAAKGLAGAAEGFADRAYLADGRLVPRTQEGSVLTRAGAVAQAEQIACAHRATAADGAPVALEVASLCLHSDTPGAAGLAHDLRERLERAGVEIRPFA